MTISTDHGRVRAAPPPAVAPGARRVVGHALAMKRRPGELLASLQSAGPVVRMRLGRTPTYLVNDPALMREVLLDADTFGRGGPITERFRKLFGNGLGVSTGDVHRRQRAFIQPAFNHAHLLRYAEVMSDVAATTAARWRDGEIVRVEREMDDLALTNMTRIVFSDKADLDRATFMEATGILLDGLFKRVADPTGLAAKLPTAANRRYAWAEGYLRTAIDGVIEACRAGAGGDDLLSSMLSAAGPDGGPAMSDRQLHDEVMTLFIAGSNTISNTLSWAFWELANHPQAEAALHAEVDSVLGGRQPELADVRGLEHTRRVVTETLRLRTQGLFLSKTAMRDAELGGYAIPAGANVMYSFHGLNHNPAIHPDPERFDPDRWLPGRADRVPRGAFMPFATGEHGCIGEQFAWAEMVISLATVASGWRLHAVPGHVPQPKLAITMPVDALPMRAERRPR